MDLASIQSAVAAHCKPVNIQNAKTYKVRDQLEDCVAEGLLVAFSDGYH